MEFSMDKKILNFNYNTFLSAFDGELTKGTVDWFFKKNIKTPKEVIYTGEKRLSRLLYFGPKRLKEVRNFINKSFPEEYDFYIRSVVLTHEEINAIQERNYFEIKLSPLNFQQKTGNFIERKEICTLKNLLDLGIQGINRLYSSRDAKENIEEELKRFTKKLPKGDYNHFMRAQ